MRNIPKGMTDTLLMTVMREDGPYPAPADYHKLVARAPDPPPEPLTLHGFELETRETVGSWLARHPDWRLLSVRPVPHTTPQVAPVG